MPVLTNNLARSLRNAAARCRARPRVSAAVAAGLVVILVSGVILSWQYLDKWRLYEIRPAGVTLELPAPPQVMPAPAAGALVYEAHAPQVAVVVAVFPAASGHEPVTGADCLHRAMAYLRSRPGISSVRYQVTEARGQTQARWNVAGVFRRDGSPCRVVGMARESAPGAQQVLCFFSAAEGASGAQRILNSTVFSTPKRND